MVTWESFLATANVKALVEAAPSRFLWQSCRVKIDEVYDIEFYLAK